MWHCVNQFRAYLLVRKFYYPKSQTYAHLDKKVKSGGADRSYSLPFFFQVYVWHAFHPHDTNIRNFIEASLDGCLFKPRSRFNLKCRLQD